MPSYADYAGIHMLQPFLRRCFLALVLLFPFLFAVSEAPAAHRFHHHDRIGVGKAVIVKAPAPTAGFTFSPTSPLVGQQVIFDASSSTCPAGPCTYAWFDDGGTTQPIPATWPLGNGQTLQYTFSGAGTKHVRLIVTDTADQTATIEQDIFIGEAQLHPAYPPASTEPPAVSGSAVQGQTLTASSGTWSESPASYSYQWIACNASGLSCFDIDGATQNTRTVAESDVGHTLRVVVRAANQVGTGEAISAATSVATTSTSLPEGTPTHCFENPEYEGVARIEACGYPGPHNVGYEVEGRECAELPEYTGSKIIKSGSLENVFIKDNKIPLVIEGNNITLNHVCIEGSTSVGLVSLGECQYEDANFVIENSTLWGTNNTDETMHAGVWNPCYRDGPLPRVHRVAMKENCNACVLGNWEVDETYILANSGVSNEGVPAEGEPVFHNEAVYINGRDRSDNPGECEPCYGEFVGTRNTMLNPQNQTAIIFGDTNTGRAPFSENYLIMELTDSFVAGSGSALGLGKASAFGSESRYVFKRNRFARCIKEISGTIPNERCASPPSWRSVGGPKALIFGEEYGYFPTGNSNSSHLLSPYPAPGANIVWSGNFWDDNLAIVPE